MDLLEPGFDWSSLHTITGQIALWLMFFHTLWATRVVRKGTDRQRVGQAVPAVGRAKGRSWFATAGWRACPSATS